ncbi:phytanoyl-CoA dioxygenase family protein [Paenibacillus aurantius]|uniref:Phytanoyl-CoA dioxygenase family protein n=1 Tax=Paenibacillus aurantius TaxID=2918900 RepID=A0AA96L9A0_9BACL|nr:phytanoyl-CoA dioxygenase family protein [Paenibacillus aurantius]WJH34267.1 phytanoyl-CoA dioxygenase family protein [Paenibacillus sp. CC-CFT747]WNQ09367.1 phytanoyl-CoA dioxygenase family protein [Paenibacillus aurantius]
MLETTYVITEQDRKEFREKGYWISPKLLDDDQIARLRKAHDRVWAGDYDGDGYPMHPQSVRPAYEELKLRKLDNGWWVNDEVRQAVTDPVMGRWAADLLETDEIRLWHDQMIYKPGVGDRETAAGNVGWHQDYGYWQATDTTEMITVWIALQDTDLTNGGMMSIAGSHRWGLIPESNSFFDQDMDSLKRKFSALGHDWTEEPCLLKAGQASFHHALTFHGSGPNRTNEPRLSVVAHLMPGGTGYRPRVQHHDNVRLLGPRPYAGQPFDNAYFPLVYSRRNS